VSNFENCIQMKNYFILFLRHVSRRKFFSVINVGGLSLGMTACILIFLYVKGELQYDKFHKNANNIYRVVTYVQTPTEDHYFGTAPAAGPAILKEFPQVSAMTRLIPESMLIQRPGMQPTQDVFLIADSSFFKIFSFQLIKGNAGEALLEPFSVVLSETASKKYFASENPVGRSLIFNRQFNCKVTGVMKDFPARSHFHSDMIVSMTTLTKLRPQMDSTQWNSFAGYTFLLFPNRSAATRVSSQLPRFIHKYAGLVMKEAKVKFTLKLEPLKDIYLHSKFGSEQSGNALNVYILSFSAILILLIACTNFVNLSTIISTERAKETGIRKLMGSTKSTLIFQFITESIVICIISFLLACILSSLFLPMFNDLAGKKIASNIFENPRDIAMLFAIGVVVGVVAGFYPSWLLSSYKPIAVLRGRFSTTTKGLRVRQGLVIFQFSISIILIATTIVTWLQLKYMQEQALGFKKDQMLVVNLPPNEETNKNFEIYKSELMNIPGVLSASGSSGIPGNQYGNMLVDIENSSGVMQRMGIDMMLVDEDFIAQYKIPLIAGELPNKEMINDSFQVVMVNEAALRKLGYHDAQLAIGKRFENNGKIIGVFKDFHYRSFHEQINPLLLVLDRRFFRFLTLNLANDHLRSTLTAIEEKWNKLVPGAAFEANFLDDSFNRQYKGEANFSRLLMYFSMLSIFVSCLGLFALSLFTTYQRTKEIGIRKVIGASVSDIVRLVMKDYLTPVTVAIIVAFPITWYLANIWLMDFAYRIKISPWIFIVTGFIAIAIAFITVSFQSIRVAISNPVKSLRTE
jgi:putative ABC transport system permease protein